MNGQEDFLKRLVEALDEADIPYMLSGSVGSSFHGQPRATNDFDVIVAPTREQLTSFVASFDDNYYVSAEAAQQALKDGSMFNIIDQATGGKADFIVKKKRDFSHEEFQRRKRVKLFDIDVCIVSPEDAILSKLEWSKEQNIGIHLRDALGVAVVQWNKLDKDYLKKWAVQLELEDQIEQLFNEAKKLVR
jgi:hypothetical protein